MTADKKDWIELLRHWAKHQPDKVFAKEPGKQGVTYLEFYRMVCSVAGQAAAYIGEQKNGQQPIAVVVDRNVTSLAAMLGVYAAGGWYVPMDAAVPLERAELFLSVAQPAAIILSDEQDPFQGCDIPRLSVEPPTVLTGNLAKEFTEDCPVNREENLPLFGIFTSGSTGVPKLVVKDCAGMKAFIDTYCRTFGFLAEERFGNQIPFYFDASTKDIFATIYLGATMVILPQQIFSFPMNLVKTLNEEEISTFVCVPSVLSIAARFQVFEAVLPKALNNVLFVGERMPMKSLNYWREALPDVRFVNLYGSTEVTGNSCYYIVNRDFGAEEVLPIGLPFETSQVILLDEEGRPANEGELCILGNGLALGYYKEEEKTRAVFTQMPSDAFGVSKRVYHSGDYGKINEYGELVCIARKDAQIKHMGHRIELGDIEVSALALACVTECCCLYEAESEKILLFCACEEENKKQLRKSLLGKLPKYMLPHEIICMQQLPHNRNGKTDRAGLLLHYREQNRKKAADWRAK